MEQKPTIENPGEGQKQSEIILPAPGTGSAEPNPNKICPNCGTANSLGAVYCYKCGLHLPEKLGSGKEMKFGGFGERLIAFIINGILSGILIIIVFSFIIASKYDVSTLNEMTDNMRTAGVVDNRIWSIMGILLVTFLIVTVLYSTIAIGIWGKTIGKAVFKLKVVKPDGSRIGIIRAFGRSIAYILNYCTLGLSFFVIAFTHKKRGLHDYIADTIVIKTD